MDNSKAKWVLERVGSLVKRWDKEKYTNGNRPLQGMIQELKQLAEEEGEGLTTGNE